MPCERNCNGNAPSGSVGYQRGQLKRLSQRNGDKPVHNSGHQPDRTKPRNATQLPPLHLYS